MLLLGDCKNWLKDIRDNSIDLILTDPPYFLINDSGSGFMGKEWDSINNEIGLNVICRSKEFASFVLKFFQLTAIEPNTTEANSVQSNVRTEEQYQKPLSNSTAQPVDKPSRNGSQRSKANINSVPDLVLTKADLLDLLSELSVSHTTAIENLPENVLFVLPYSYLRRRLNGIVQGNVLKSPTDLQCEDHLIQVSSMDAVRINAVIEAMIGSVLDSKSIGETTTPVDYAANTVEGRKYKHIILSNTNRLKTIHWIIWLLYVINVIQRRNTIPNSTTINYDLIYQFHKSWAIQAYRVLKEGKIAFIMCSPRQDVIYITIQAFQDAGFKVAYTSIFHTFASGFPKAKNNGDGSYQNFSPKPAVEVILVMSKGRTKTWLDDCRIPYQSEDDMDNAKIRFPVGARNERFNPEYGWNDNSMVNLPFEPADKKGRFPANLLCQDDILNDGQKHDRSTVAYSNNVPDIRGGNYCNEKGRLDIDKPRMSDYGDKGSYSRYFSLDQWWAGHKTSKQKSGNIWNEFDAWMKEQDFSDDDQIEANMEKAKKKLAELKQNRYEIKTHNTFPFLIVPKASKGERNKGCEDLPPNYTNFSTLYDKCAKCGKYIFLNPNRPTKCKCEKPERQYISYKGNHHPTVKPLKLMSYLITMGSREGDLILDPFCGSGTVCIAAHQLHRKWLGIERNPDYAEIIKKRLAHPLAQLKLTSYLENEVPQT